MLNSPFSPSFLSRGLTKGASKLTFNSIIGNLEKTVSTINQMIPLYNQVKPLINTSTTFFKSIGKTLKKHTPPVQANYQNEVINVEVKEIIKKEVNTPLKKASTPSKPYFI